MRKGRFAVVLFLLALVAVGAVLARMLARGFVEAINTKTRFKASVPESKAKQP